MGDALREHLGYLSDANRLTRFEQAVARAVAPGDTAVDVGCGFGVLGLLCLKAGAAHVWGIDETPAIEIARETMARAGLAERYTCLHESSFAAVLPQAVDVLICDHVGYFGVDYGVIALVGDARRRFLKPGGKVLPSRLVLHAAAVRSAACREMAEAWASDPVPADFAWLREYGVNTKYRHSFGADELVSDPVLLGTVDLSEDSPERLAFTAELAVRGDGELDGLAGWFECEIFDGVWMTNSPLAEDRIDRPQAFLPFSAPLAVRGGDRVTLSISLRHDPFTILAWTARVARTGQTTRQSTWASTILDPQDRVLPADKLPRLGPVGEARRTLLSLVDGKASGAEIEQALRAAYPDLFPTPAQFGRFVRAELARSAR